MRKLTTHEFIEKAIAIHGNRYDYSKSEYKDSHTKIEIICPEHGPFWQTPNAHLNGSGCPNCCTFNHKYTKDEFITKARIKHGDKYGYSKVEYANNSTKVCIICPEHGEFWQTPANHLYGQGCPSCKYENKYFKYNTETLIERFKSVHGDTYDYSKTVFSGITSPVTITCREHGDFKQVPYVHISGCGCPVCGRAKSNNAKMLTRDEFIEKARILHGDAYDYSKVVYNGYDNKVTIICPKHGEFEQTPDSHLQGKGCNSCSIRHSDGEEELLYYIQNICGLKAETNVRYLIPPYEIDIYIPDKKIAIEYNGIRWHTEEFGKDKEYHLKKTELCKSKGVHLMHIFEDEYLLHKDIVLSKISHIIGSDYGKDRIYARKTKVAVINTKEARKFLEKYHIQGFSPSTMYYGCFYNAELVGVMCFKKTKNEWELTRFATDYNYISCGIGGKLLKKFIIDNKPAKIKSFADRRWTLDENDNIYTKLGFKLDGITPPDYRYVLNNRMERIHKFNLRKKTLCKKYGIDKNKTELEATQELGFYRIWDCGLFRYVMSFNCE